MYIPKFIEYNKSTTVQIPSHFICYANEFMINMLDLGTQYKITPDVKL